MATIEFRPTGEIVDYLPGESIFAVALRSAVRVETACVGKGTCGLCRVRVVSGEEHLAEPGAIDEKHLGNVYWLTKTRLACQAVCNGGGDIVVDVILKKPTGT